MPKIITGVARSVWTGELAKHCLPLYCPLLIASITAWQFTVTKQERCHMSGVAFTWHKKLHETWRGVNRYWSTKKNREWLQLRLSWPKRMDVNHFVSMASQICCVAKLSSWKHVVVVVVVVVTQFILQRLFLTYLLLLKHVGPLRSKAIIVRTRRPLARQRSLLWHPMPMELLPSKALLQENSLLAASTAWVGPTGFCRGHT
jgi:hypothetical protein